LVLLALLSLDDDGLLLSFDECLLLLDEECLLVLNKGAVLVVEVDENVLLLLELNDPIFPIVSHT